MLFHWVVLDPLAAPTLGYLTEMTNRHLMNRTSAFRIALALSACDFLRRTSMNALAVSVDIAAIRAFSAATQWPADVAKIGTIRVAPTTSLAGNSLWTFRQSV